jgi:hypothetical protein
MASLPFCLPAAGGVRAAAGRSLGAFARRRAAGSGGPPAPACLKHLPGYAGGVRRRSAWRNARLSCKLRPAACAVLCRGAEQWSATHSPARATRLPTVHIFPMHTV